MNKYSLTGFLLCVAGVAIRGFQAISKLMETEGRQQESDWGTLSIDQMLMEEHLAAIERMSTGILKNTVEFLITSPLWIELLVVGVLLLVISGFIKR
jgi:hypothetical protein